jgi:hypothetical protein
LKGKKPQGRRLLLGESQKDETAAAAVKWLNSEEE